AGALQVRKSRPVRSIEVPRDAATSSSTGHARKSQPNVYGVRCHGVGRSDGTRAWLERASFDGDWLQLKANGILQPSFLVQALWKWSDLTVPCLTLWTFALTLLWLRPPRPVVSTLSRYPGAVACAAVTASMLVTVVFNLLFYLMASALPGGHAEWF